MELLRTIRKKSFLSEFAYISLNIALAIAVLVIVLTVASPLPAIALVLLSKWRIFAVRPRYWAANIQANLVDIVVSVGAVVMMYSVESLKYSLAIQIAIAVLYTLWLIVLKPRSNKKAVVTQAGTALFVGVTVLFVASYSWPLEILVASMAVVGYVTARHVLTQYEEDHLQFMSLLWAFVLAQLGWILSHWVIAYTVPVLGIKVPQASIIIILVAFVVYRVYDSYQKHGKVRSADVFMLVLFSVSVVAVMVILFSITPTGAL